MADPTKNKIKSGFPDSFDNLEVHEIPSLYSSWKKELGGHVKLLRAGVGVCTCGFLSQHPLLCPFWPLRWGHMMECDRAVVEGVLARATSLGSSAEDRRVCPGPLGSS